MGWDTGRAEAAGGTGGEPGGCLAVAIRLPVRLVAFGVVLPLRLLWDAVAAVWRAGRLGLRWAVRRLVAPVLAFLWRYLVAWPLTRLFLYVVVPFVRVVVVPAGRAAWAAARFLWRRVAVPLLSALGGALAWAWEVLVVPAARVVWAVVAFLGRYLLLVPLSALWRWVVLPVAREVWAALGFAWRGTAFVSRALGRLLGLLFRYGVALPVAWVWRWSGAPAARALRRAGRWYRRVVWRPVGDALADARRSVRRALNLPPRPGRRLEKAEPRRGRR
jgi:hypothetical protein